MNLRGIRLNGRLITVDVVRTVAALHTLESIEVYCVETADILRFVDLLCAINKMNYASAGKGALNSIHVCFHMSKSYIQAGVHSPSVIALEKVSQPSRAEDAPEVLL